MAEKAKVSAALHDEVPLSMPVKAHEPEGAEAAVDKRSGVKIGRVPAGIREISAGGMLLKVEDGVVWAPEAIAGDVRRHVQSFIDAAERKAKAELAAIKRLADEANLPERIARIEKKLGLRM